MAIKLLEAALEIFTLEIFRAEDIVIIHDQIKVYGHRMRSPTMGAFILFKHAVHDFRGETALAMTHCHCVAVVVSCPADWCSVVHR